MINANVSVQFLIMICLIFPIYMFNEIAFNEIAPLNCCLSTRIKLNTNITFSKIPMKIDKNTANAYACYKQYSKEYYVCCARIVYFFINIQWNYI